MRQKLITKVQTLADLKALVAKFDKAGVPDDEPINPDTTQPLPAETRSAEAKYSNRSRKDQVVGDGIVIWVEMDF